MAPWSCHHFGNHSEIVHHKTTKPHFVRYVGQVFFQLWVNLFSLPSDYADCQIVGVYS